MRLRKSREHEFENISLIYDFCENNLRNRFEFFYKYCDKLGHREIKWPKYP